MSRKLPPSELRPWRKVRKAAISWTCWCCNKEIAPGVFYLAFSEPPSAYYNVKWRHEAECLSCAANNGKIEPLGDYL